MKKKLQIPLGYKPYKTIEGKFASHVGPYFLKNKFPNTIFGTLYNLGAKSSLISNEL